VLRKGSSQSSGTDRAGDRDPSIVLCRPALFWVVGRGGRAGGRIECVMAGRCSTCKFTGSSTVGSGLCIVIGINSRRDETVIVRVLYIFLMRVRLLVSEEERAAPSSDAAASACVPGGWRRPLLSCPCMYRCMLPSIGASGTFFQKEGGRDRTREGIEGRGAQRARLKNGLTQRERARRIIHVCIEHFCSLSLSLSSRQRHRQGS
jgi:hypothetical protein